MTIINVNKFYYLRGGAERAFFSLTDILEQHGHEVIPFSMQHPLNIPTAWSKYFPSYVEFGHETSPSPSPIRRGNNPTSAVATRPRAACEANGGMVSPIAIGERHGRTRTASGWASEHEREGVARKARGIINSLRAVGRMFWSFEAARKFDQLLTDTKPDLIHIHNIYHQLSPSILPVAKRHGIPVVMTAHDYQLIWPDYLLCGYPLETSPIDLPPTLSLQERGHLQRRGNPSPFRIIPRRCTHGSIIKSTLTALEWSFHHTLGVYRNNIDRIIVPSAYVHDVFTGAGIVSDQLTVLPHAIETTASKPLAKSKTPSLLFFGRLSREKGVDILLKMMHNEKPPLSLRIAGTGPDEMRLKLIVERLKIQGNVTFLGQLDTMTLRKEIQKAWAVVVPSRVPETFGYSVLESLAEGTPVIASNIGALPELVNGLGGGILTRPESTEDLTKAIERMFTDIKHWNTEARRAQQIIKKDFSPETYYQRILDIYTQLT